MLIHHTAGYVGHHVVAFCVGFRDRSLIILRLLRLLLLSQSVVVLYFRLKQLLMLLETLLPLLHLPIRRARNNGRRRHFNLRRSLHMPPRLV